MLKPIIEIDNLGKKYKIGAHKEPYLSLRDEFAKTGRRIATAFSRLTPHSSPLTSHTSPEDFWALKDVSFSVQKGEAVGIIGRNGAGKSTLLKILSMITPPTEGKITCRGRIASLLEVGTGFHPELTGRENIFLNGAILGMTRAEIRRKFDEIVAFAEIEKFLDTPVKRYSSGMYVRLAFAVAAHLEPEILVVDEVLAVGDAQFQKKCLGKMGEVAKGGRTVLFVSHNMAAVTSLCARGILLQNGRIVHSGEIGGVINAYMGSLSDITRVALAGRKDRGGTGLLRFTETWIENNRGEAVAAVISGEDATIAVRYTSDQGVPVDNVVIAFSLKGPFNIRLTDLSNAHVGLTFNALQPCGVVRCRLPQLPLNAGVCQYNVYCSINGIVADHVLDAGELRVDVGDYYGSGRLPGAAWGPLLMKQEWSVANAGSHE